MWKDLDLEQMEREVNAWAGPRPPEEVERIVVMVRLELYNQGLPCGPKALQERLDVHEHLRPLPSQRTIARMLARNGLTYGRTGWYEGEAPEGLPESARRWNPYNQEVSGPASS
jgi:hypothetical protein